MSTNKPICPKCGELLDSHEYEDHDIIQVFADPMPGRYLAFTNDDGTFSAAPATMFALCNSKTILYELHRDYYERDDGCGYRRKTDLCDPIKSIQPLYTMESGEWEVAADISNYLGIFMDNDPIAKLYEHASYTVAENMPFFQNTVRLGHIKPEATKTTD